MNVHISVFPEENALECTSDSTCIAHQTCRHSLYNVMLLVHNPVGPCRMGIDLQILSITLTSRRLVFFEGSTSSSSEKNTRVWQVRCSGEGNPMQ